MYSILCLCNDKSGLLLDYLTIVFAFGVILDEKCLCFSSRCKIPSFGSAFHVATGGHDLGLTKVSVAADYSDSVPDSSFYGYHPLEDLKPGKRVQETKLSPAEVARTTVEVGT